MMSAREKVGFGVAGTEGGAAAADPDTDRSRRALLKGLGVAAAGVVVGGVLTPEEAEAHGTLHQESNNGDPAIHGNNTDGGAGVEGTSSQAAGVHGTGGFWGVVGVGNGIGVEGRTVGGGGTGVVGSGFGGVEGRSDSSGTGVWGRSATGVGVEASCPSGIALNVIGPARFSTAGAGIIPAQQNSIFVSNPAITAVSHITMTLTGNPGAVASGIPAVVVWVERQPGTGFVARLSRKVTNATPFTYLIVEPG
jgi:hypothetical protein